jgi:hypothetical protein
MSQTHEGALKVLAKKRNMTIDELKLKLETHSFCFICGEWKPHAEFGIDRSRFNGLDRKCHSCRRRPNPYASLKGRTSPFKGKHHTVESSRKMSEARIGNQNRTGKPFTAEQRKQISQSVKKVVVRGEQHPNWKGGITPLNQAIRASAEYADWRTAVFERDHYTCQNCGDDSGGNLHAHHIKPFAFYPELRFDVSNGIALCEMCHWELHSRDLTEEEIGLIEISYHYALDVFGNKTKLANAWNISVRTLNKIITRTGRFKLED